MPIVISTYHYKPPPKRKRKGPRIEAPVIIAIYPKTRVAKKDRQPLGSGAAAKVASRLRPPAGEQASQPQHISPAIAPHKMAIITVKAVQRQREQQQMAKLMQGSERRSMVIAKPSLLNELTPEAANAPSRCSRRGASRDRWVLPFATVQMESRGNMPRRVVDPSQCRG
jgi:hypothetical protein